MQKKPCSEEPIGAEPLDNWHIQWEIRGGSSIGADLVNTMWHRDSIFFYDDDENEIPFEWLTNASGSSRSERYYFFNSPEDEIAFDQDVSKTYFLDFHEFDNIDRDTLEIRFKARSVECGQILEPLEFYQNNQRMDDLNLGGGKLIIFRK